MPDTPWLALVALIAMFLLPLVPEWLFEGPRKVKHWPRQHVCGRCDEPWIDGHVCGSDRRAAPASVPVELRRLDEE